MFEAMYFFYGVAVMLLFVPLSIVLLRPAIPPLLRAIRATLALPFRIQKVGLERTRTEYRAIVPLTTAQYAALSTLLGVNTLILVIGLSERFDWIAPGVATVALVCAALTAAHASLVQRSN